MLTQPNRSCSPCPERGRLCMPKEEQLSFEASSHIFRRPVSFTLVCFNLLLLSSWSHGLQSKQAGQVKRAPTRLQGGS